MLPGRVYLRSGGDYRLLHPWVLLVADELRERTLFFNGLGRRSQYLDYESGESLRGKGLAEVAPTVDDDLRALFAGTGSER